MAKTYRWPCFWSKATRKSSCRDEERTIAKRIVMRKARGNIRLIMGRYVTKKDLEERKKKILSANFV